MTPTRTALGIPGRDDQWPDLSPDGHRQRRDLHADLRSALGAAEAGGDDDELAREVAVAQLGEWIDAYDGGDHHRDLNNIASTHQGLRQIFDLMPTDSAAAWEAIAARLETIDEPVEGYRATLAEGVRSGRVVARRQVDAAVEQGAVAAGDDSSFVALLDRYDAAGIDDDALRVRLQSGVDHARRAFAGLGGFLADEYRPHAADADGVGRDRYLRAAQEFLGTTVDPDELYEWGWAEIDRLWRRLDEVTDAIDADASTAEVIDRLHTDPAYAATSLDEFVALMTERQHQALDQLAGVHFEVPDQIRAIDVKVEPAGTALAPHYTPPSEDFSRPGTVWYPVEGRDFFPLFEEVATAYHEGFPGHHLQVGIQMSHADRLSRFHRQLVWYPGSGEGWALYAERLMGELGYYEQPHFEAGLLASQLFRSCRIVIDIGVHLDLPIPGDVTFHPGERWSYELAEELLRTRGLQPAAFAASEVTRYFGWPGQAISYKVGERAILELRDQARSAPGFDAKAWHSKLLSVGSVGLDVLAAHTTAGS